MWVIVGLGNPGAEYENTPHNAGFAAVNLLAERLDASFRSHTRLRGRIARGRHNANPVLLVKPQTYMNLSGSCVASVLHYYHADPSTLLVVLDDADLDMGRLRLRASGGSGGHRGLQSVLDAVPSDTVARLRIGIGRGSPDTPLINHVLKPLDAETQNVFNAAVGTAADAILRVLDEGIDKAMTACNARPAQHAGGRIESNV